MASRGLVKPQKFRNFGQSQHGVQWVEGTAKRQPFEPSVCKHLPTSQQSQLEDFAIGHGEYFGGVTLRFGISARLFAGEPMSAFLAIGHTARVKNFLLFPHRSYSFR